MTDDDAMLRQESPDEIITLRDVKILDHFGVVSLQYEIILLQGSVTIVFELVMNAPVIFREFFFTKQKKMTPFLEDE